MRHPAALSTTCLHPCRPDDVTWAESCADWPQPSEQGMPIPGADANENGRPGCEAAVREANARKTSLVAGDRAGGFPHAQGHDADLLDTGALGRVDDLDDVLVLERTVADDEHRLVAALLEDVPEPGLKLG